jgi:hypothetical protein
MSQFTMDAEEFARMLHHAADCISYYHRVSSYHDCNDCGANPECKYLPQWGGMTRINCPLWRETEESKWITKN